MWYCGNGLWDTALGRSYQFVVQFQQPHLRPVVAFKDRLHCGSHSTLSRSHQLHVCHIRTIHPSLSYPRAGYRPTVDQTHPAITPRPKRAVPFRRLPHATAQPLNLRQRQSPLCQLSFPAHPLYPSIRRDSESHPSSVLYQTDNFATLYNALWHRRQQNRPAQACLAVSLPTSPRYALCSKGRSSQQERAANRTL